MKIVNIVGARPNFMKIAPIIKAMRKRPQICPLLVHTGQHYDASMAGRFFEELDIPRPDVSLDVGSGSHAFQTAEVMKRLEPVLEREKPDLVLVVGDVNSTMAAAVTAAKLKIKVAHVEAGLRSFDRDMPEEINRIVTDAVCDFLFVTEESGQTNLLHEGVCKDKIFFVGNVMIDSLEASRKLWAQSRILDTLNLRKSDYGVVTLHRPSNVDDMRTLEGLMSALCTISERCPLVFPVHPRTIGALKSLSRVSDHVHFGKDTLVNKGIRCIDPVGYLDFMALVASSRIVLTDSGGLQEETTVLGIPCLTLRENTERPVTVTHGTNRVIGSTPSRIEKEAAALLDIPLRPSIPPPLWDGQAAERVVNILVEQL
ncbi:UDP-N-acetylglucosamine 2-epimerase-like protein [Nitrospira sp. KM1]|uniref:non-hydrolyzing UDP-N-acetylglucosamine 2-epimerase n=1 Tax=Nitrospira sp. KM1 TaxID=1936990 RepID=UPI0013A784C3|nr:UDP-N-acetylglucosamine 2-epimerase (non-hydrolyzing) [Nitrospira sp. KM1]BCA54110.1 UDP-N-acetylglucosamine 2-epimerase-like protein [Nitrospira sp. KM1]